MDLYLVRHGESAIPDDSVQSDYPLSLLGRDQARQVGERFRGLHIDRLVTTPYRRTQETAGAIAATTDTEVIEEPGLGEIEPGEMATTPYSQRKERWPEFFAQPVISPLMDYSPFGGESAGGFYERVTGAFVERIWEAHWREPLTVVVVCHGGTINVILHHLLGMPWEGWMMFSIDHTSVSMFDVRLDRPRVRYINDTAHLGELSRGHRGQVGGEAPRPRPR